MKQGSFMFACFVMVSAFCVLPAEAQDYNKSYQTYIVDTFDQSKEVEWTWEVHASKFVAEGYPKLQNFEGMPQALRVMYPDTEDGSRGYLGVQTKFNRMGDNWFDLIPTIDGEPYEIPFKGEVARLDFWVWGADYYYQLEVLVRDAEGRVHTLPIGWLNFKGWKNMGVKIPTHIKQSTRYLDDSGFSLVCFRVRSSPSERVDNFYFFIDEIQALTNIFVNSYDGHELVNAAFDEGDSDTTTEGK
ncbi:MAG: flagellar filament outer layer protein FlaA [Treponemataceae bacterium]